MEATQPSLVQRPLGAQSFPLNGCQLGDARLGQRKLISKQFAAKGSALGSALNFDELTAARHHDVHINVSPAAF